MSQCAQNIGLAEGIPDRYMGKIHAVQNQIDNRIARVSWTEIGVDVSGAAVG